MKGRVDWQVDVGNGDFLRDDIAVQQITLGLERNNALVGGRQNFRRGRVGRSRQLRSANLGGLTGARRSSCQGFPIGVSRLIKGHGPDLDGWGD